MALTGRVPVWNLKLPSFKRSRANRASTAVRWLPTSKPAMPPASNQTLPTPPLASIRSSPVLAVTERSARTSGSAIVSSVPSSDTATSGSYGQYFGIFAPGVEKTGQRRKLNCPPAPASPPGRPYKVRRRPTLGQRSVVSTLRPDGSELRRAGPARAARRPTSPPPGRRDRSRSFTCRAAWWINMPSPLQVLDPRARAAAISGVVAGA